MAAAWTAALTLSNDRSIAEGSADALEGFLDHGAGPTAAELRRHLRWEDEAA